MLVVHPPRCVRPSLLPPPPCAHTSILSAQSELNDWGRNPPDGCALESCEPLTRWVVKMSGPEPAAGMPRLYEGEMYR